MLNELIQSVFGDLDSSIRLVDSATGDLAIRLGQDAGEDRYIVFRYSPTTDKWYATKQSIPLPRGNWLWMNMNQMALEAIAKAAYAAAE